MPQCKSVVDTILDTGLKKATAAYLIRLIADKISCRKCDSELSNAFEPFADQRRSNFSKAYFQIKLPAQGLSLEPFFAFSSSQSVNSHEFALLEVVADAASFLHLGALISHQ